MLNPVVIPAPAALVLLAALAAALLYRRWLDAPAARRPRHRLAGAVGPYRPRPWEEIAAELAREIPEIHRRWPADELDAALDEAEQASDTEWVLNRANGEMTATERAWARADTFRAVEAAA